MRTLSCLAVAAFFLSAVAIAQPPRQTPPQAPPLMRAAPMPPQAPPLAETAEVCPVLDTTDCKCGCLEMGYCTCFVGKEKAAPPVVEDDQSQKRGTGLIPRRIAPHLPPAGNCKCGCVQTGKCVCKDCDHPKGKSPCPPNPNCQCGCTVTGKCVCKDCDHPALKKPVKQTYGRWVWGKEKGDRVFLMVPFDRFDSGEYQKGRWEFNEKRYYPWDAISKRWGDPESSPPEWAPPLPSQSKSAAKKNHGRWVKRAGNPGMSYLMVGVRQFGKWDGKSYFPYDRQTRKWGAAQKAPPSWAPPVPVQRPQARRLRIQAAPLVRFAPPPMFGFGGFGGACRGGG